MRRVILCHGCGLRSDVPDEHTKNKMRCPHCGVICPVPERPGLPPLEESAPAAPARKSPAPPPPRSKPELPAPSSEAEDDWAKFLLEESPAATPAPAPAPTPSAPASAPTPPATAAIERRAAAPVPPKRKVPEPPRRQHEPDWDRPISVEDNPAAEPAKPQLQLSLDEPLPAAPSEPVLDDEEDDNPYEVADREERRCPECRKVIDHEAVVCVHCGFHFEKREKMRREYQPLERDWESGLPLVWRARIFGTCAAVTLVFNIALVAMIDWGLAFGYGLPWLCATGMLAFLLGTYNRIHMTRTKRGRVTLKETWRICFVPQEEHNLDLALFEGVGTLQKFERTFWDWIMLLILLPFAIVPGVLWWFLVMGRTSYEVSLTRDHGYAAKILYRGWSKTLQEEIAKTLSVAARMRYDRT